MNVLVMERLAIEFRAFQTRASRLPSKLTMPPGPSKRRSAIALEAARFLCWLIAPD